jgi:hypothetical protein
MRFSNLCQVIEQVTRFDMVAGSSRFQGQSGHSAQFLDSASFSKRITRVADTIASFHSHTTQISIVGTAFLYNLRTSSSVVLGDSKP